MCEKRVLGPCSDCPYPLLHACVGAGPGREGHGACQGHPGGLNPAAAWCLEGSTLLLLGAWA